MSTPKGPPPKLSVEEVLEVLPGNKDDPSWVNGDVIARVLSVEDKPTRTGKKMWNVELGSDTSGARLHLALFTVPGFSRGALIELTGSGISRTEYNGTQQIGIGKNVEIHVIQSSPPARQAPPTQRAPKGDARGGSPPPQQGTLPGTEPEPRPLAIPGQTVGLAMKEARELVCWAYGIDGAEQRVDALTDPELWRKIYAAASSFIRMSNALGAGKLAPPLTGPAPAAAQTPQPPANPPAGSTLPPASTPPANRYKSAADMPDVEDEDVPF